MSLKISAAIGLFAAVFMFLGDMLLYFTPKKFELDGTFQPYVDVMAQIPRWRIKLGGLIGPFAAFFYCIGFSFFYVSVLESARVLACIVFLMSSLGIMIGGAMHAQFTYFGLIGKTGSDGAVTEVKKNVKMLSIASIFPTAISLFLFAGLILFQKTIFPWWFFLFTPAATVGLQVFWMKLPQPFRIVLFGGWNNLIYIIFFTSALLYL